MNDGVNDWKSHSRQSSNLTGHFAHACLAKEDYIFQPPWKPRVATRLMVSVSVLKGKEGSISLHSPPSFWLAGMVVASIDCGTGNSTFLASLSVKLGYYLL